MLVCSSGITLIYVVFLAWNEFDLFSVMLFNMHFFFRSVPGMP